MHKQSIHSFYLFLSLSHSTAPVVCLIDVTPIFQYLHNLSSPDFVFIFSSVLTPFIVTRFRVQFALIYIYPSDGKGASYRPDHHLMPFFQLQSRYTQEIER